MEYLIISEDPTTHVKSAFNTDWYDYENNYNADYKMIIINRVKDTISFDGKNFQEIAEDSL